MPLIFQSPLPLFLCLLLSVLPSLCYIALAKLSDVLSATSFRWERESGNEVGSLSSSVSCSRLLLRCFWSRRSRSEEFRWKSSWARIWSHSLCLCVICKNCSWFTDLKHCFTDDEWTQQPFMNDTWKFALVIGGKVYVAWKRKMLHDETLHDVTDGHQVYIHRFMGHLILQLLRPRAVSRLFDEIIKSLRS